MPQYKMSFMGKPHKPVSYGPLKPERGPNGYEPETIEADTADEAAAKAKEWYNEDLVVQKARAEERGDGPMAGFFLMEPEDVAIITVLSESGDFGAYDFETLTRDPVSALFTDLFANLGGES